MTQRIINIVDLSALQQEYETIVDFAANNFLPNAFATTPNSHTVPSRSATTMCIIVQIYILAIINYVTNFDHFTFQPLYPQFMSR